MSMVDKHVRMLAHILLRTDGIDYKRELARLKVHRMIPSTFKDKIYIPHPNLILPTGQKIIITKILLSKPSIGLVRSYENAKTRFGNALIRSGREKTTKNPDASMLQLTPTERKIFDAVKTWNLRPMEIAQRIGMSPEEVYRHMTNIRKKGFIDPKQKLNKGISSEKPPHSKGVDMHKLEKGGEKKIQ
jgi:DNA-binding CsgD family transcriptional regulator